MYEIHLNIADQWVLYSTQYGNFDVVAYFLDKKDAEFARDMFEQRDGGKNAAHPSTSPMHRSGWLARKAVAS